MRCSHGRGAATRPSANSLELLMRWVACPMCTRSGVATFLPRIVSTPHDRTGYRERQDARFRADPISSVAVGAISNPSVSAEKSQINGFLFRICHKIRHFCHVCEAFRSGRSELDHEFPLINLLGCGWTGRRFSAAARETASAYPSVSRGGAMRRPPFLHSGGFGRVLPTASVAVIVAAPASGCWPHGNPLLRLCLRCRPCSAGGR